MTNFEALSLVLGGINTLIIVGTLYALWRQLRQFNQNMKFSAYSKHVDDYSRVSELLIDPELNSLYYSRDEDISRLSHDEQTFYNYIALILGYCETLWLLRFEKGWIDDKQWKTWEWWLAYQWFPLDLFRLYWSKERGVFNEGFAKYIDAQYEAFTRRVQA